MTLSYRVGLIAVLAFIFACQAFSQELNITTEYGNVEGYASSTHRIWKGIPYARAPTGSYRWRSPQAAIPWNDTISTIDFNSPCIQGGDFAVVTSPTPNEDCLFLNIWAPINSNATSALPVMFWIHGGSFIAGAGSAYDGDYLSGQELIFVSINYRLGAFGFLAHPALLESSTSSNGVGFYGIQDQRFALEWVRDNIANFGGNPSDVTISGESAGAISICAHFAAPLSQGLFSKAIMESGFCTLNDNTTGLAMGEAFSANAGCQAYSTDAEQLSCLYNKTTTQLSNAQANYTKFEPTIFPDELSAQPIAIIAAGGGVRVPLLLGTNLNEYSLFDCPTVLFGLTDTSYEELIEADYGTTYGAELLAAYPVKNYSTPIAAFIDEQSDINFKCPTRDLADYFSLNTTVYMYSFEHAPSYLPAVIYGEYLPDLVSCLGVAHSFELAFLFNVYAVAVGANLTEAEQVLSDAMRNAWADFVVSAYPTLPSIQWPLFNTTTQTYVHLNLNISTGNKFRQSYCDLIDTIEAEMAASTTGSTTSTTTSTSTSSSTTTTTTTTGSGDATQCAISMIVLLSAVVSALLF